MQAPLMPCCVLYLPLLGLQAGIKPYVDGVVMADAQIRLEYFYEYTFRAGFSVSAGVRGESPFIDFRPIWEQSQRQEARFGL